MNVTLLIDAIVRQTTVIIAPRDIAVYPGDTWYLASSDTASVSVSRRAPTGPWMTEIAAGAANATSVRVAFAAGTVHVSYESEGKLHYARRIGTTWADHVVTDVVAQHAMAVDDCGSPHFAVWTGTSPIETRYHRWTPAGWRSGDFAPSSCLFGDGLDIALTPSAALISYYDCPHLLATIPLR